MGILTQWHKYFTRNIISLFSMSFSFYCKTRHRQVMEVSVIFLAVLMLYFYLCLFKTITWPLLKVNTPVSFHPSYTFSTSSLSWFFFPSVFFHFQPPIIWSPFDLISFFYRISYGLPERNQWFSLLMLLDKSLWLSIPVICASRPLKHIICIIHFLRLLMDLEGSIVELRALMSSSQCCVAKTKHSLDL